LIGLPAGFGQREYPGSLARMTAAAGKGGAGRTLISGKHIKAAAIQVKN